MFPFMSAYPYLNMMGQLGRRNQTQSPWDDIDTTATPGFGGPVAQAPWDTPTSTSSSRSTGGGWASKPGFGQGLTALGTSLLESAGRGDFAGGLARGAQGFGDALSQGAEQERRRKIEAQEEERRVAAESRATEQEADRNRAADQSYERGNVELEAWRQEQDRGRQSRERTGKSAEQMAVEIQSLAARDPKNEKLQVMAKRAAGYALGEDSDINKLADLHEKMTDEAFYMQDEERDIAAKIQGKKRMYEAGVEVNPVEESQRDNARADAGLAISRGHLAVSRERGQQEKEGLTDLQAYDRLEKKVQEKVSRKIQQKFDAKGPQFGAATPAELAQWKREATIEAMEEMKQRMNQVYQFNAAGEGGPIR